MRVRFPLWLPQLLKEKEMSIAPLGRLKEIEWNVTSRRDSRWNKSGTSTVAMIFQYAPEALTWIDKCEKKYGKRPKDLEYDAHKV
jgi:hypothetical protein